MESEVFFGGVAQLVNFTAASECLMTIYTRWAQSHQLYTLED